MTQEDIAQKLGITRQYLNQILRGKRRPSVKLAEEIVKLTDHSFFDFRPDLKEILRKHL